MECHIGEASIHYVEHGSAVPLVVLHGAGVDHREVEAAIEAIVPADGVRRIYVDLPGMGRSTAHGLASNDDVVDLLGEAIERIGQGPALLLGHSYGAYLARGVAARRPDLVLGLALVCPIGEHSTEVPPPSVVRQDDDAHQELDGELRAGFDDYFVVRTRATARRYREQVVPGTKTVDEAALGRILAAWAIDLGDTPYPGPSLIMAGRQDATVGFVDAVGLLDRYPHADLAVVDGAGHALLHEQPELVAQHLARWLGRVARPIT